MISRKRLRLQPRPATPWSLPGKRAECLVTIVTGKPVQLQLVEQGRYSHSKMVASLVCAKDDPKMAALLVLWEPQVLTAGLSPPVFARLAEKSLLREWSAATARSSGVKRVVCLRGVEPEEASAQLGAALPWRLPRRPDHRPGART